ncbi:MAG TPA: RsmD family RNA methyltransferase [Gemmataceae bacterium]|jgi:16S rRNA (guanine966-N2)-methyltransferase|nr:RsmD family RNA methyltransferase [Gemmataceae bacterium]
MEPSKVEIRIVAGSLRGRKVKTVVHDELRPTPQRVRESLFSILGNAIPGRPFFDLFAGTGVHGLEAISRGGSEAIFVELDAKLANAIDAKMREWGIANQGHVLRADVYRWAERWIPPQVPVNLFLSPPFIDLTERYQAFLKLIQLLADKAPMESCLCIQAEDGFPTEQLPGVNWDVRKYGRNVLAIWVKEEPAAVEATPEPV